jgi:phage terminase small subunit
MATSKASTQPPGEALSPKHEAFVQAYVSRGMNGTKAYRAAYPGARVEEILAAGAERAEITVEQVLRELAVLGFSDIGKVVRWRPELVYEELEDADNLDQPVRQVLQSRVLVIDSATLPPEARLAVAEVSQTANGLRVKMHDKHGPLVSIGKHLGMFVHQVQVRARYAISDEPMSAEEWKKQYVKEG